MKPIPGLDGYYATSNGRIISTRSSDSREIKARERRGYMVVTLTVIVKGKRQRHRLGVHRLVLLAHGGVPTDESQQARHLNGDSLDNRASNLAWGTAKDNAADAVRHGTLGPGMKARRRKLTLQQVIEIRARRMAGESGASIGKEFGICDSYPTKLVKGRCWTHVAAQRA